MSLAQGRVPGGWKKANDVPTCEGGNKENTLNYRLVSLTSVLTKICEKTVYDRWTKHLEENYLIMEKQFCFRKGRSCTTSLISIYSGVIDDRKK